MQKFWWGNSSIHWMKWSKMGIPKSRGGMGFKDLICFNKALLAKQSWQLWQTPDSLVSSGLCKENTTQMGLFWKQKWVITPLMRGGVF
jgi:hypothetical protein